MSFATGRVVSVVYTNHEGRTAVRRILPHYQEFSACPPWHPEPQWLLVATDVDRGVRRHFAMDKISEWKVAADQSLPWRSGEAGAG